MLYIYTPAGEVPTAAAYDWTMKVPLQEALTGLRARGFQFGRHLLIGAVQAFQYFPATTGAGGAYSYWVGPTPSDLLTQIDAFCAAGAGSIIGYAWDDGRKGVVSELGNTASLRAAFAAGINNCRQNYW